MNFNACAITGHRPKSFPWKYNETDPGCVLLKEVLAGQISELVNKGVTDWFSGMALGVDIYLDSSSSLMLPFKNLMNDSYCRDTSIKIRSHLDVKRRNGDFIGSFAVYGYAKDPENKNKLIVDPEAAETVREIFAHRLAGQSCKAITDDLNALGVLSPMEYKRSRGINFKTGYRVHSKAQWSPIAVQRILENEVYLGVMTQGKRAAPNYKVKTVVERPPEAWMRVEGTHEAIITREDFQLVALLKDKDTRKAPGGPAWSVRCPGWYAAETTRATWFARPASMGTRPTAISYAPSTEQTSRCVPATASARKSWRKLSWRGSTSTFGLWRNCAGRWKPSAAVPCSGSRWSEWTNT